jgi:Fe-S oxidoreductase/nitrate reductase gamma subunit
MAVPARENFVLMPPGTELVMYIVLAPFAAVFLYGLYMWLRGGVLFWLLRSFRSDPWGWLRGVARYAAAQRRVLQDRAAGVMHLSISYGILVLLIGTTLVAVDHDLLRPLTMRLLIGDFYLVYEVFLDAFGILLIAGLSLAIYRRTAQRPSRLGYRGEYLAILFILLFIAVTGYLLEGIRIYARSPPWGIYSFVGAVIAVGLKTAAPPPDLLVPMYQVLWWIHAVVAFGGVAAIPYTNLFHTLAAVLNSAARQGVAAEPVRLETPFILREVSLSGELPELGVRRASDLKPSERLQVYACTDCGRCDEGCPALIAGTPLSPRMVVQKLRRVLWEGGESRDLFEARLFSLDELYACTTCGACEEACPVLISPVALIVELRRALALEGKIPSKAVQTLSNLARMKNPYGLPQSERLRLEEELRALGAKTLEEEPGAEIVYWVGCMGVYDPRARQVVKHMVRLLSSCGIRFAVLVAREVCNGDVARRLGEEGRYQELAEEALELLGPAADKTILTHCPHCFDVFSRQYRDLGSRLKVLNHVQLLASLTRTGALRPALEGSAVIHDSCILARMRGQVSEPREALRGASLVEPARRGRGTFCCGAGGGSYWVDVKRLKRENIARMEELLQRNPDVVLAECPFCLAMLEDAARVVGVDKKVRVMDIAEALRPARDA